MNDSSEQDASGEVIAVDVSVWAAAGDEARRREARAASVRWVTWMAFIGVGIVAMAATFVGLPLVLASSVLLVAAVGVWLVRSVALPRLLPAAAPALDEIRREASRAWDLALTRDDAGRLATLGATVAAASRITSTEGSDVVELEREVLEIEGGYLWQYGIGSTGP